MKKERFKWPEKKGDKNWPTTKKEMGEMVQEHEGEFLYGHNLKVGLGNKFETGCQECGSMGEMISSRVNGELEYRLCRDCYRKLKMTNTDKGRGETTP